MQTFTALRGFLALLADKPDLIEADLSRFHHIDYRDRWRRDVDGVRRLTLRMIYVRVIHLPADSALSLHYSDGASAWDLHAHLLADLSARLAGIEYSSRPGHGSNDADTGTTKQDPEAHTRRIEAAKARARAHNSRSSAVSAAIDQARANAHAIEGGETANE